MTIDHETHHALVEIAGSKGKDIFTVQKRLQELLASLVVSEPTPEPEDTPDGTTAPKKRIRTLKQNDAIHLYREHLAKALNEAGYGMRKILKADVEIDWNKDMVRRYLWLPVQKALFDKDTSADLTSDEVTKVWEHLNRLISERTGIHIPFPSEEQNTRLTAMENLANENYPTHSPTAFD